VLINASQLLEKKKKESPQWLELKNDTSQCWCSSMEIPFLNASNELLFLSIYGNMQNINNWILDDGNGQLSHHEYK